MVFSKITPDVLSNDALVKALLKLPDKILHHHEVDSLPNLILHDLGHDKHLNLNKAMFLVDSPDFDCLKGIAGFCKDECKMHHDDVWQDPSRFIGDMRDAQFHNKINHFLHHSMKRRTSNKQELCELGKSMGIEKPHVFTWDMRHGNHGILLYDTDNECLCEADNELLHHIAALLGLCPV